MPDTAEITTCAYCDLPSTHRGEGEAVCPGHVHMDARAEYVPLEGFTPLELGAYIDYALQPSDETDARVIRFVAAHIGYDIIRGNGEKWDSTDEAVLEAAESGDVSDLDGNPDFPDFMHGGAFEWLRELRDRAEDAFAQSAYVPAGAYAGGNGDAGAFGIWCLACDVQYDHDAPTFHAAGCDAPTAYGAESILETFRDAYCDAAVWTEIYDPTGEGQGTPLDSIGFDRDDFTAEALELITADCEDFISSEIRLLAGLEVSQAGHDFWLTRNGHGAGFWDRGHGRIGDELAEACRPYGKAYVHVIGDPDTGSAQLDYSS
jgi:hypothetical protein